MKVYVITTGTYSDYKIVGVATDEKARDAIIENYNRLSYYSSARSEEFETDVYTPFVTMGLFWIDNYVSIDTGEWVTDSREICADEVTDYSAPGVVIEYEYWGNPAYRVIIFSSDEGHARKSALDLIAEYKAKKAGVAL